MQVLLYCFRVIACPYPLFECGECVQVRLECQRLVGSRHQSAAFELLETLSQQQEQAYDKIYQWVQASHA